MMGIQRIQLREVSNMSVADHFSLVAPAYDALRTTDEAPVRRIRELLPDRRVVGLDIGCGTGRYSRLLQSLLPDGSLLAASDVSEAMLAELPAAHDGRALMVPLRCTAEQLPVRTGCLDLVMAFNSVHHFDLGRFLAEVARVLRAGGRLFVYTRTPERSSGPGDCSWSTSRASAIPGPAPPSGSGRRSRVATTRPSRSTNPTSCARPSPPSWLACPVPRSAGSMSTSCW